MLRTRAFIVCFAVSILVAAAATGTAAPASEELWELYNSGRHEEALAQAEELLAVSPGDRDLVHLVGRFLFDLGRREESQPYFERTIAGEERDWRYAWSLFYMGALHLDRGHDEAAAAAWSEVRDGGITRNVARNATNNLRFFALDDDFAAWSHLETAHCRFAFSPQLATQDLEAFANAHEAAYTELVDFFGGEPATHVRYIVWGSVEEATELCGIQSLGFARPKLCTIHCRWDQTVGHELTHVISFQALQPVARTGLINEGLAVCFDLNGRDRLATARAAVHEAGLSELDLAAWWEDPSGADEGLLYPVAGAWLKFLLDRGGKEKLLRLATDQTLPSAREIYGEQLDAWLDEYTTSLLAEESP